VLVLDECTASVDHETDALIQVRTPTLASISAVSTLRCALPFGCCSVCEICVFLVICALFSSPHPI
jgi:hypothetical protein